MAQACEETRRNPCHSHLWFFTMQGKGTRHTQSVKLSMSRAKWAKSKRSFWLAPEILRGSNRFGAALANSYGLETDNPCMNMQVHFCTVCQCLPQVLCKTVPMMSVWYEYIQCQQEIYQGVCTGSLLAMPQGPGTHSSWMAWLKQNKSCPWMLPKALTNDAASAWFTECTLYTKAYVRIQYFWLYVN